MSVLFYVRQVPLRLLAGAALVGVLLVMFFVRGCGTPVTQGDKVMQGPMPADTALHFNLSKERILRVRTDSGEVKQTYVPIDGKVDVTVSNDGVVEVDVKTAGVTFKPGLSALVTDRLRLGADFQLAYWNRLELHVGVAGPRIVGYGGLGYRLDQFGLSNTSVQVIYATDRTVGLGLSVRF